MKVTIYLLLFVAGAAAQSSGGGCGGSVVSAASVGSPAAGASSSMRLNVAAKNSGAESQPGSQPAQPRSQAGAVLPQIQPRRPFAYQPSISCACGTVDASLLTSSSTYQEVPVLKGIGGSYRFEHVLIQEAKQFVYTGVTTLNVAMGRPGSGGELIPAFPLMSAAAPQNFWFDRPAPPQIAGTYDLAVGFTAALPLGNGIVSNFRLGSVAWEVCGYNVQ